MPRTIDLWLTDGWKDGRMDRLMTIRCPQSGTLIKQGKICITSHINLTLQYKYQPEGQRAEGWYWSCDFFFYMNCCFLLNIFIIYMNRYLVFVSCKNFILVFLSQNQGIFNVQIYCDVILSSILKCSYHDIITWVQTADKNRKKLKVQRSSRKV